MGHIIIALGILILFGYFAFLYVKYFKYPRRYFLNGKISCKKFADGTIKNYNPDGNLCFETLPDGTIRFYNNYMDISSEILPDGTTKQYEEDGSVSIEILPIKLKNISIKMALHFKKTLTRLRFGLINMEILKASNIQNLFVSSNQKTKP